MKEYLQMLIIIPIVMILGLISSKEVDLFELFILTLLFTAIGMIGWTCGKYLSSLHFDEDNRDIKQNPKVYRYARAYGALIGFLIMLLIALIVV